MFLVILVSCLSILIVWDFIYSLNLLIMWICKIILLIFGGVIIINGMVVFIVIV